jgi:hypothetical protein
MDGHVKRNYYKEHTAKHQEEAKIAWLIQHSRNQAELQNQNDPHGTRHHIGKAGKIASSCSSRII